MDSAPFFITTSRGKHNNSIANGVLLGLFLVALMLSASLVIASPLVALDPKAASLGNAVTAEQVGATSALFNPATLTEIPVGREGRRREYKLFAAKFPTVDIQPSKPAVGSDPYYDIDLTVNDDRGTELFQGNDPRDSAWVPEIDRLAFYLPGYGEIDIDRSVLDYVLAPLFYEFQRNRDSKWVFASSLIFLPGGAHFKKESWNIEPTSFSLGIFGVAPTIAYEVTPNLSIGFGLELTTAGTKLGVDYRNTSLIVGAVNQLVDDAICPAGANQLEDICGGVFDGFNNQDSILHIYMDGLEDRFNYSFNAGILWKPKHWLNLGLSYQHETVYKLKGNSGVIVSDDLYDFFNSFMDDIPILRQILVEGKQWSQTIKGTSTMVLPFPAKIDAGVSLQLTTKLRLNIDYHWRRSKIFRDAEVSFDSLEEPHTRILIATVLGIGNGWVNPDEKLSIKPSARNVGVHFKNRGNFAYGLSYSYSERLTLRAGYERKETSVLESQPVGPILNDLRTIGLGFNLKWDHDTEVDFAIINLKSKDYSAAGDSVLTEVGLFPPLSFWGGSNLSSHVEANILQLSWNKRI